MNLENITKEEKSERLDIRKVNLSIVTGRCYEYKGQYYEVTGNHQSKNEVTGEWLSYIDYKDVLTGSKYARSEKVFKSKYRLLTEQLK